VQALEGAITKGIIKPLAAGDGVNANDVAFGSSFPYLALPHSGSGTTARGTSSGTTGGAASGTAGSAPSGAVSSGFGGTSSNLPVLPITVALVGAAIAGSGLVLRARTR